MRRLKGCLMSSSCYTQSLLQSMVEDVEDLLKVKENLEKKGIKIAWKDKGVRVKSFVKDDFVWSKINGWVWSIWDTLQTCIRASGHSLSRNKSFSC